MKYLVIFRACPSALNLEVKPYVAANSNSAARLVGLNTHFRWEYSPGSDLFFVYSDGQDTALGGFNGMSTRQFVAKFTRLFRL